MQVECYNYIEHYFNDNTFVSFTVFSRCWFNDMG